LCHSPGDRIGTSVPPRKFFLKRELLSMTNVIIRRTHTGAILSLLKEHLFGVVMYYRHEFINNCRCCIQCSTELMPGESYADAGSDGEMPICLGCIEEMSIGDILHITGAAGIEELLELCSSRKIIKTLPAYYTVQNRNPRHSSESVQEYDAELAAYENSYRDDNSTPSEH